MTILDSDPLTLDDFQWQDVRHALKTFKQMRLKNRVPKFAYQGKTRLSIELSITPAKHIHVNWS